MHCILRFGVVGGLTLDALSHAINSSLSLLLLSPHRQKGPNRFLFISSWHAIYSLENKTCRSLTCMGDPWKYDLLTHIERCQYSNYHFQRAKFSTTKNSKEKMNYYFIVLSLRLGKDLNVSKAWLFYQGIAKNNWLLLKLWLGYDKYYPINGLIVITADQSVSCLNTTMDTW